MVSLWPFGKATDETTNFEKTLSTLAIKIQRTNLKRDQFRNRQRRYKALWTLYTTLTYTVCFLILALVTGWRNWGPTEYSVVVGAPPIIYLVRSLLVTYYSSRLLAIQGQLDDLNAQRDAAIEKFKAATKYNSTQQLLEKYGAAPITTPKSSPGRASPKHRTGSTGGNNSAHQRQPARTGLPPPPTANIARPGVDVYNGPQTPTGRPFSSPLANSLPPLLTEPTASFAPNAFPSSPQYSTAPPSGVAHSEPKWYDRIMDVLLGDDESRPGNRIALICAHCRLVNGQAPPGTKSLDEIGRWRCSECHQSNGKESVVQKMLQDVKAEGVSSSNSEIRQSREPSHEEMTEKIRARQKLDGTDDDVFTDGERSVTPQVGDVESEAEDDAVEDAMITEVDASPPAKSTRSQAKGRKGYKSSD